MRIVTFFVSCSLILAAQDVSPQDQKQKDWRFAHPDALLVGAIRPKALIESPIVTAAIQQAAPKDANGAQVTAMLGLAKGLFAELNEVRFSVIQTGELGKQKLDFVALVDGKFDESILGLLMSNSKTSGKPGFRRIDANTLLIGEGPSLDQAAERMAQTEPKLRSRAFEGTETLVTNDLWISGRIPENPFAMLGASVAALPAGLAPTATTPDFTKNLRRIAFGISLRDGVDGELVVQTSTAEMAESLVKEALKSLAEKPSAMSRLIGARADGATAHFTLNVPRSLALEEIRNASQQRTSIAANSASANSNAPQPLDPPKSVRRSIMIQGLDQGPLEVPLPQQTH